MTLIFTFEKCQTTIIKICLMNMMLANFSDVGDYAIMMYDDRAERVDSLHDMKELIEAGGVTSIEKTMMV